MGSDGYMQQANDADSAVCGKQVCDVCGCACEEAFYGTAMSEDHVMCRACAARYWGDIAFDHLKVEPR